MEYKFVRDFEPRTGTLGKIILYKDAEIIHLNGDLAEELVKKTEICREFSFTGLDEETTLKELKKASNLLGDRLGRHKDIPKEPRFLGGGQVLGGSLAYCHNNLFFVAGNSISYGDINRRALERCLEGSGLELRTSKKEHGWAISVEPFEDYIKRKFEGGRR